MMATASPRPMPAAIRPLASAATSAAKVADGDVGPAGAGAHREGDPSRLGARTTAAGTSARLPWVVSGRTSGVDFSCTVGSFGVRRTGTPPTLGPRGAGTLRAMADRTQSSVEIAAEPGAVLDVIADFERLPGVGARGHLGDGAQRGRRRLGRPGRVPPARRGHQGHTTCSSTTGTSTRTAPAASRGTWCAATLLKGLDGTYALARTAARAPR